jgi:hypothetical protein
MRRRDFLAAILATACAPAIVRAATLMPVRPIGEAGLIVAPEWIELGTLAGWYDDDDLLWSLDP